MIFFQKKFQVFFIIFKICEFVVLLNFLRMVILLKNYNFLEKISLGLFFLTNLHDIVAKSLKIFECRPACKVPSPVRIRVRRIREEIILFGRPAHVRIVNCFQIARRRGIEDIDIAAISLSLVDVPSPKKKLIFEHGF